MRHRFQIGTTYDLLICSYILQSVQFTTIQAKENFRNSQIVQMTSKKIAQDTFKDAPSEMVKILPTWEDEIEYITSKVEHFYNSAKDKTIAVVCMNDTDMQRYTLL